MNINELFEKHSDEYLEFEKVENKFSTRPDLHAFILLDKLFPSERDMVSAAEYDEIFLSVAPEQIKTLSENQIVELIRCGVRYSTDYDCFRMLV